MGGTIRATTFGAYSSVSRLLSAAQSSSFELRLCPTGQSAHRGEQAAQSPYRKLTFGATNPRGASLTAPQQLLCILLRDLQLPAHLTKYLLRGCLLAPQEQHDVFLFPAVLLREVVERAAGFPADAAFRHVSDQVMHGHEDDPQDTCWTNPNACAPGAKPIRSKTGRNRRLPRL